MFENIKTIADIQNKPEFILVDRDYDVLCLMHSIGMITSDYADVTQDNDAWLQYYDNDYSGLYVVLDESGTDYLAVFGYWGTVPYLNKDLDLLWYNGELKV